MFSAADSALSAAENGAGFLERERSRDEQMLDGVEQAADGVARGGGAQIVGGDVQIDLRAGDQPMAEQIADGHQAYSRTHQVRGKSVPQAMRGERTTEAAALAPGAHTLVNAAS